MERTYEYDESMQITLVKDPYLEVAEVKADSKKIKETKFDEAKTKETALEVWQAALEVAKEETVEEPVIETAEPSINMFDEVSFGEQAVDSESIAEPEVSLEEPVEEVPSFTMGTIEENKVSEDERDAINETITAGGAYNGNGTEYSKYLEAQEEEREEEKEVTREEFQKNFEYVPFAEETKEYIRVTVDEYMGLLQKEAEAERDMHQAKVNLDSAEKEKVKYDTENEDELNTAKTAISDLANEGDKLWRKFVALEESNENVKDLHRVLYKLNEDYTSKRDSIEGQSLVYQENIDSLKQSDEEKSKKYTEVVQEIKDYVQNKNEEFMKIVELDQDAREKDEDLKAAIPKREGIKSIVEESTNFEIPTTFKERQNPTSVHNLNFEQDYIAEEGSSRM